MGNPGSLIEGALRRKITADTLFNASGFASSYKFVARSHILSTLSIWMEEQPAYLARNYRQQVETGNAFFVENRDGSYTLVSENAGNKVDVAKKIRQRAYENLLELARNAAIVNCELVYSEAVNSAEHSSQFRPLIETFESSLAERNASGRYFPSYGHTALAKVYLRASEPGWKDKFTFHINAAREKLAEESPVSSWHDSTRKDLAAFELLAGRSGNSSVVGSPRKKAERAVGVTREDVRRLKALRDKIMNEGYEPNDEEEAFLLSMFAKLKKLRE